jgi:hypothetical protein
LKDNGHRPPPLCLPVFHKFNQGNARCRASPTARSLARSNYYRISCSSIYDPSVIYILCLHAHGACCSSLSLPPTLLRSSQFFTSPLMPHTHPTSTPSNFQLVFDSALKAYKKRTKNDLLTHPLADRLKTCNSASSILTVLQELVQEFNQSQRRNTTWLDPIVNVLLAFSETLGEGVGSVCFRA